MHVMLSLLVVLVCEEVLVPLKLKQNIGLQYAR